MRQDGDTAEAQPNNMSPEDFIRQLAIMFEGGVISGRAGHCWLAVLRGISLPRQHNDFVWVGCICI